MSIRKMNLVQATGCLISLAIYLFAPILGFSVLVPVGLTGEFCSRLDFLFIVPVILLGVTLIISLLPIGPFTSIAGILTSLGLLIIGVSCKEVIGSKFTDLVQMMGADAELSAITYSLGSYATSLILKMNWGLIVPIILMLLAAIGGAALSMVQANQGSANPRATAGGSAYSTRSAPSIGYRASSRSSSPPSHRSNTTRYHR